MIRFLKETTLQVIEGFDEATDSITEEAEETFKNGEKADGDIFNEHGNYADIQFGDGSVAYNVPKDRFEVI
jgi:prepilin-type processing-associated H-X9-DG protein